MNTLDQLPTEDEIIAHIATLKSPSGVYLTPELKAYYQAEMDRCAKLHFEHSWYLDKDAFALMARVNAYPDLQTKYSRYARDSSAASMAPSYMEVAYTEKAESIVKADLPGMLNHLRVNSGLNIVCSYAFYKSDQAPQRCPIPSLLASMSGSEVDVMEEDDRELQSLVAPLTYNAVQSCLVFFGPDPEDIAPEFTGAIPWLQPGGGVVDLEGEALHWFNRAWEDVISFFEEVGRKLSV